jgi:hypothetical protein
LGKGGDIGFRFDLFIAPYTKISTVLKSTLSGTKYLKNEPDFFLSKTKNVGLKKK